MDTGGSHSDLTDEYAAVRKEMESVAEYLGKSVLREVDEDEFMMAVAEAGGEDYEDAGEEWIVWTTANEVMAVSKALEEQGVQVKGSETTMVPTTPTEVSGTDAKKVQRLIDRLEELDDVQDVYSTMDMTDEVIAALEEE